MSSRPPEPAAETSESKSRWPRWRRSMFAGALILLLAAIADAVVHDMPRPVYFVVFFVGYVFLAYGFFLAMNARHDLKKKG